MVREPLILDVGCGNRPRGTINVDVFRPGCWNPQTDRAGAYMSRYRNMPNFFLASAEFLPFRNEVFDKVLAFELLEHLDDPFKALKEMVRVSKNRIIITSPHRYGVSAHMPHHESFLNRTWFVKACNRLQVQCKIKLSYTPIFQMGWLQFGRRIHGMKVMIRK